jgi:hypothetical protein
MTAAQRQRDKLRAWCVLFVVLSLLLPNAPAMVNSGGWHRHRTDRLYRLSARDFATLPRSLAERIHTDIRRWSAIAHGGYFTAMEQPDALPEEVRASFRPLC